MALEVTVKLQELEVTVKLQELDGEDDAAELTVAMPAIAPLPASGAPKRLPSALRRPKVVAEALRMYVKSKVENDGRADCTRARPRERTTAGGVHPPTRATNHHQSTGKRRHPGGVLRCGRFEHVETQRRPIRERDREETRPRSRSGDVPDAALQIDARRVAIDVRRPHEVVPPVGDFVVGSGRVQVLGERR